INQLYFEPSRGHHRSEMGFVVAAEVANALVKFTEKPMMSWRQDTDNPATPNGPYGGIDLRAIVFDMFQNIDIQYGIERWTIRKCSEGSDNHIRCQSAPPRRKSSL